jgi:subtilisin family serine protease
MVTKQPLETMTHARVARESPGLGTRFAARSDRPLVIAVLDTGIDLPHPRLRRLLLRGATFVDGTQTPQDDNGHGTGMAGVLAAWVGSPAERLDAQPRAQLLPVKVADSKGHTVDVEVANGIRWAVDRGARVLSVSLGTEDIPQMREAARYAYEHGALIVAASPGGATPYPAPAIYPHALAVGASTASGEPLTPAPHRVPHLVLARGEGVRTTKLGGGLDAYAPCASIAAPVVAALAARLFMRYPHMSVDGAIAAIERGATPVHGQLTPDRVHGWGIVNVENTLRIASRLPARDPMQLK